MQKCEQCFINDKTTRYKLISPNGYDQARLKYRFNEDEYYLCKTCIAKSYVICKECACVSSRMFNQGSEGFCAKCNTSDHILQFNFDPCKKLKSFYNEYGSLAPEVASMQGDVFFGVELEVAINNDYSTRKVADETQAAIGDKFAVLKYDGSVNQEGTRGFEIVSAPATLAFHNKAWKNFFAFAKSTKYFQPINNHCGMHVHMSRSALDTGMIRSMVHLIYGEHNQAFIKAVAQRPSNKYCDYTPKSANHIDDHYTALNRSKRNTVELRVFQGIVDEEIFNKNIEFCQAMYNYVSKVKSTDKADFEFEPFVAFILEDAELYPNLSKYLGTLACINKKTISKAYGRIASYVG